MSKTDSTTFCFSHLTSFSFQIFPPIPGATFSQGKGLRGPPSLPIYLAHQPSPQPPCLKLHCLHRKRCWWAPGSTGFLLPSLCAHFIVLCTDLCYFAPSGLYLRPSLRTALQWNSVILVLGNLYHPRVIDSRWGTSAEIWKPSPLAFKYNNLWDGVYAPELSVESDWVWVSPWKLTLA